MYVYIRICVYKKVLSHCHYWWAMPL